MTRSERERWDERYRTEEFEPSTSPSPLLRAYIDTLPSGRALDVATGTGRNALALAENGHAVDAIDISGEALKRAREHERERYREREHGDGSEQSGEDSLAIEWVRADIDEYDFSESTYAAINVSYYHGLDRLTDIKRALKPGGMLLYEHHLRSADPVESGPSTDRFRFGSNELLRACLDLTILRYEERTTERDGRTGARVYLLARRSSGPAQTYPREPTPIE
ncbi:SAM-dependent methyltransferase [Halobacteriales archaeon QS_3_64_16]|nr:MAG: SAM-dependent methyltransferase [Halobacteriales archaeon QS_3_64_16]